MLKAHRLAWALKNGPLPEGGLVCHSCDNPKCCNPSHLFIGSHFENTRDMLKKGRGKRPPVHFGERHHNAKFSAEDALKIANDNRTANVVAREFGVSTKTVYRLRKGETWKLHPGLTRRRNAEATLFRGGDWEAWAR